MSTETPEYADSPDRPDDTDAAVQLGSEETLVGPIGSDPLDAGYSPNDRPVAIDDFGTTADEMAEGEPLEDRLARERPDDPEVAEHRSGRLVEPDEGVRADDDSQLVATDVGIDGGAASAEEAAVHDIAGDRFAGDGTDDALRSGLAGDGTDDALSTAGVLAGDGTDGALDPALAGDAQEVTADVDDLIETDDTPEVAAAEADAQRDAADAQRDTAADPAPRA